MAPKPARLPSTACWPRSRSSTSSAASRTNIGLFRPHSAKTQTSARHAIDTGYLERLLAAGPVTASRASMNLCPLKTSSALAAALFSASASTGKPQAVSGTTAAESRMGYVAGRREGLRLMPNRLAQHSTASGSTCRSALRQTATGNRRMAPSYKVATLPPTCSFSSPASWSLLWIVADGHNRSYRCIADSDIDGDAVLIAGRALRLRPSMIRAACAAGPPRRRRRR